MDRHSEYKDSGIEWIGEIPKNWEVKPLKHIVTYNDDVLPDDTDPDFEFTYIQISDVSQTDGVEKGRRILFSESPSRARRVLRKNDVIISTVRTYLRSIGTIQDERDDLIGSTGFCVLRSTDKVFPSFLSSVVSSESFVASVVSNSEGVSYPAINSADLVKLKVVLPPPPEQTQIAKYLDREISRINSLDRKTKRKIELLKEQRTALISQCVTKGLDPNVEMKDSWIEWIGEIPKNWEVKPLKHIVTYNDDVLPDDTDPDFEFTYIQISDVSQTDGVEKGRRILFSESPSRARRVLRKNDVIISTVRTYLRSIGTIQDERDDLIGSTGFCVLRSTDKVFPSFLSSVVSSESFVASVVSNSEGVSYPAINSADLVKLKVVLPPPPEQIQIAQYLDKEISRIDSLVEKEIKRIDLLKEYHQSLISNVVTGKVKVTDETA